MDQMQGISIRELVQVLEGVQAERQVIHLAQVVEDSLLSTVGDFLKQKGGGTPSAPKLAEVD